MQYDIQSISWPGWDVIRLIGQGRAGAVFEIRKADSSNELAALRILSIPQDPQQITQLRSQGYDDQAIAHVFREQAKTVARQYSLMLKLNGDHVVHCQDVRYAQHEDGIGLDIFVQMELLSPLVKSLSQHTPDEAVIAMACDLCTGLEDCRQQGMLHGDVKPQSIFLSGNGSYKLGEVGLGLPSESTRRFMAPERFQNAGADYSADVYSLGLSLYWILNERRMPFLPLPPAAMSMEMEADVLRRRLSGETLPPPKHGSAGLKAIVMKACAYRPADRYANAGQMLAALQQLQSAPQPANDPDATVYIRPQPAPAPKPAPAPAPAPAPKPAPKPAKGRSPALLILNLILLLVLIGVSTFALVVALQNDGSSVSYYQGRDEEPDEDEPEEAMDDAPVAEEFSASIEVDGKTKWIAPPMEVGVEYCTTEQFMGQDVYTQLIDIGLSENKKYISFGADISMVVRHTGWVGPYVTPYANGNDLNNSWSAHFTCFNQGATLWCGEEVSGLQSYLQIWYIK